MKDVKREAKGDDGNRTNMSEIGKIEVADVIVQDGGESNSGNKEENGIERMNRRNRAGV